MPDQRMTIGSFSMVTGLSIPTLRHYDEIGLLEPVEVDSRTGYRRYGYAQTDIGRQIRLYRQAGLSIEQISTLLGGDRDDARAILIQRRTELDEGAARTRALLDQLIDDGAGRSGPLRPVAGYHLVAINIGVDSEAELATARRFWGQVFGSELEDWGFGSQQIVLGMGDSVSFFNIRVRSATEPHRGHTSAFGLGVPGLDATHQRALAAGATENYPPTDGDQMPRHSLIVDPAGNRVVLWESGQ